MSKVMCMVPTDLPIDSRSEEEYDIIDQMHFMTALNPGPFLDTFRDF